MRDYHCLETDRKKRKLACGMSNLENFADVSLSRMHRNLGFLHFWKNVKNLEIFNSKTIARIAKFPQFRKLLKILEFSFKYSRIKWNT